MIRHTVAFSLRHPRGSSGEAAFLRDARVLSTVPGVRRFEQLAQVSPKSDLPFAFSTEFDGAAEHAAYDAHPDHVAFVRDRWAVEVEQFQELDYELLPDQAEPTPVSTSGAAPVWRDLFDGRTLAGWRSIPRVYGSVWPGGPSVYDVAEHLDPGDDEVAARHPAAWRVEDGAVVGEQQPPGSGFGGYLISEEAFGDFELELEMRPDWPADTGVMLRRRPDSWEGFQVLVDHRRSGSIGGFFGNGLDSLHAVPFVLDVEVDPVTGPPVRLVEEDPATSLEPLTDEKRALLDRAGEADDLVRAWRFDAWNHLRVRCTGGALPRLTTWVNGVLVADLDTSKRLGEHYDPDEVARLLGDRGHIAFEVHDNDERFGEERWGRGAACRWRHVRLRELG